jgi:putative PIN family toxin of toxin-antitoxin system
MLKVVLDTNVIISGTIMDRGVTFQILKGWERGDFFIIISEPILREVEKVLHYPRIKEKRHLTELDIEAVLNTLRTYSINTPAKIKIDAILEDPQDDKFIAAAIEGEADYIVSGDRHLKDLKDYQGIPIVSPSEFLQITDLRSKG